MFWNGTDAVGLRVPLTTTFYVDCVKNRPVCRFIFHHHHRSALLATRVSLFPSRTQASYEYLPTAERDRPNSWWIQSPLPQVIMTWQTVMMMRCALDVSQAICLYILCWCHIFFRASHFPVNLLCHLPPLQIWTHGIELENATKELPRALSVVTLPTRRRSVYQLFLSYWMVDLSGSQK